MKNWKDIAKDLPLNGKVQTECPENCGSGEKLSVTHSMKSYWCNCYRCGFTDIEYKGKQSLAELKKLQALNDAAAKIELTLDLPNDFTEELPRHARAWLFRAGISPNLWKYHSIGYSEALDRVILPVYDTQGNLEWYQCRALQSGQKPKYLQPSRCRDKVMFRVLRDRENLQRAIVVEDILSAIRVGVHINTYSVLGTKITTPQAAELSKYGTVTTWLDPDRAGRTGAYKIRKTMALVTDVTNIVTSVDPKDLSDKQIKEQLCIHQK